MIKESNRQFETGDKIEEVVWKGKIKIKSNRKLKVFRKEKFILKKSDQKFYTPSVCSSNSFFDRVLDELVRTKQEIITECLKGVQTETKMKRIKSKDLITM